MFDAYATLQGAADSNLQPGDTVLIRGGTYTSTPSEWARVLWIKRSGAMGKPITFENYHNEVVIVDGEACPMSCTYCDNVGLGPDYWKNILGCAQGVTRRYVITVDASFVTLRGLRVQNSDREAVQVECIKSQCAGGTLEGITLEDIEVTRSGLWGGNGASAGINFLRVRNSIVRRSLVTESYAGFVFSYCQFVTAEDNLAYHNWMGGATNKVGDNADGFSGGSGIRGSDDLTWRGLVSINNCDDNIDLSHNERSTVENTISIAAGCYRGNSGGYKVGNSDTRDFSFDLVVAGNINIASGLEGIGNRAATRGKFINNISYKSGTDGMRSAETSKNNISMGSAGVDFRGTGPNRNFNMCSDNNSKGCVDPNDIKSAVATDVFVNPDGDPAYAQWGGIHIDCDNTDGRNMVNIEDLQCIRRQVYDNFSLKPNSPAKDTGVFVAGIHCPTADDDPASPMGPDPTCRHWRGSAPDMGMFEFGIDFKNLFPTLPPPTSPSPSDPPSNGKPPSDVNPPPSETGFSAFKNIFYPARGETITVRYQLERPEHLFIIVYDRRGREVRTLANENAPAGPGSKSWDGRNATGEKVSSGIYLLVLKAEGTVFKKKVVVLR